MKKRNIIFPILFVLISLAGFSQDFNEVFITERKINPQDSNKLFFRIENTNFFKNNEYFGLLEEGYTCLGTLLKSKLVYYPSPNSKLEAGVHLLKYFGKDTYTQIYPIFSFQVNICKGLDILLGSLYSGYNHKLIEPLYRPEKHFEKNYENGIQIMTNLKRFKSDLWMDWERFIFAGDPYKEEFSVGTSNELYITDPESKFKLSIPFQGIVSHKGGQINSDTLNMQSLANLAGGLSIEQKINTTYFNSFGINGYMAFYNDISPAKKQAYNNGYGFYTDAWVNTKFINLFAGYWQGSHFIAPRGEQLYQSVSNKDSTIVPLNQMLFVKVGFKKEVYKDVSFELRFEGYYEMKDKNFDYSYGLHIIFNRNFFMKKI